MVLGAKAADMKAMAKIPGSDDGIARRCKEMAGFVPYYLMKMIHSNAKSAFAWAFLLRFFQGTDEVPAVRKQVTVSFTHLVLHLKHAECRIRRRFYLCS